MAGVASQSVHAFFPGFPLLVRAVATVTGLAPNTSGVATTIAMATVAATLLARTLSGTAFAVTLALSAALMAMLMLVAETSLLFTP